MTVRVSVVDDGAAGADIQRVGGREEGKRQPRLLHPSAKRRQQTAHGGASGGGQVLVGDDPLQWRVRLQRLLRQQRPDEGRRDAERSLHAVRRSR